MSINRNTAEEKLLGWERWLYCLHGAALIMLVQGVIKAFENEILTGILFNIEETTQVAIFPAYYEDLSLVFISPARLVLWLLIEMAALGTAAILALHPTWRRSGSVKRLNLIFGYLLAGWVNLLALGAQDPVNVAETGSEYNLIVIGYLLLIGLGYWRSRKKRKAEDLFP